MPTGSTTTSVGKSTSGTRFLSPFFEQQNQSLIGRLTGQTGQAKPFGDLLSDIPSTSFSDIPVDEKVYSPELLNQLRNVVFAAEPAQAQAQFQGAIRGIPGAAASSPSFVGNALEQILRGARASRDIRMTDLEDRAARANAAQRLGLLNMRLGREQQLAQQSLGRASLATQREGIQANQQTQLQSILASLLRPQPFSESVQLSGGRTSSPGITSLGAGFGGFYG